MKKVEVPDVVVNNVFDSSFDDVVSFLGRKFVLYSEKENEINYKR